MTTTNIEAIKERCRELSREYIQADLEWIQARRAAAELNKWHQARVSIRRRKLEEARQRYKSELKRVESSAALEELKELVPQFNHDSERMADSLTEAKRLMAQCDEGTVRGAEVWQADNLPLLLETADGGVVMRRRGV